MTIEPWHYTARSHGEGRIGIRLPGAEHVLSRDEAAKLHQSLGDALHGHAELKSTKGEPVETENKKLSDEELSAWIEDLKNLDIDSGSTEISGVRVEVSEDSSTHSSDVRMSMSLIDYGVELYREGSKEISYGNWVDTMWGRWHKVE